MRTICVLSLYLSCLDATFNAQNTISLEQDRGVSTQTALVTLADGCIEEICVLLSYANNDSLIVFSGARTNIFQVPGGEHDDRRVEIDPKKFKSLLFAGRIFESHTINVPGLRGGRQYFFEKFYTTPILEMFELHSTYHNDAVVTYFAKLLGSPFLFRLENISGDGIVFMPLIVTNLDHNIGTEFRNSIQVSREDLESFARTITKSKLGLLSLN